MSVIALGIIWGLPYFFVKLVVPELSPLVIAWGRVSLATLILLPIAWQRGALRLLVRKPDRGKDCASGRQGGLSSRTARKIPALRGCDINRFHGVCRN